MVEGGILREIKKVWILTFEFDGIASFGGLGAAVREFAESLVEKGVNVKVLMPSHGRHRDLKVSNSLSLRFLNDVYSGTRIGADCKQYSYSIGVEEGKIGNIQVVFFKSFSSWNPLEEWEIYSNVEEKASLFSLSLMNYSKNSNLDELPDLIHINDWHSVLAGVNAVRIIEERTRRPVALHFTIHLSSDYSFPWHYASENWSGLSNSLKYVWRVDKHHLESYRETWESINGDIEKFGIIESDAVSSVSYSYLKEKILSKVDWVENKSCVIYNSTSWEVREVMEYALRKYGTTSRYFIRKEITNLVNSIPEKVGYFDEYRPLVVSSGRLVYQKGFDYLIDASSNKFNILILGMRAGDYYHENYLYGLVNKKANGKAVILTSKLDKELFKLIHYSANSFVALSRWEPFGISLIEAMAVGLPVVTSYVGGFKEIIVEVRKGGFGIFADPWINMDYLRKAIESISLLTEASDLAEVGETNRANNLLNEIPLQELRGSPELGRELRERAIRRVNENFRRKHSVKMLLECYEKAREMAIKRWNSIS
jgi:starch synthase